MSFDPKTVLPIFHHPKCKLTFDAYNGDYDCLYHTTIVCEDCRYSAGSPGRKNPEAKCNQIKEKKR